MKAKRKHPDKALTAVQVRQLKQPGRYADGNGLYLVVDPSGAKRWLLRLVVQGRRRDIGLGGASLVTLAEARERALTYRRTAREGGDPLAERRKAQVVVPTFAAVVDASTLSTGPPGPTPSTPSSGATPCSSMPVRSSGRGSSIRSTRLTCCACSLRSG